MTLSNYFCNICYQPGQQLSEMYKLTLLVIYFVTSSFKEKVYNLYVIFCTIFFILIPKIKKIKKKNFKNQKNRFK